MSIIPGIKNPMLSETFRDSQEIPGCRSDSAFVQFEFSDDHIVNTMMTVTARVTQRSGALAPHGGRKMSTRLVCRASKGDSAKFDNNDIDRRVAMLSMVSGLSLVGGVWSSPAFAQEYETFFGAASPPTSYGGYGGNADEDAKYTFEYPAGWKSSVPNKVEKGTQGIDCRVTNVCALIYMSMPFEYC